MRVSLRQLYFTLGVNRALLLATAGAAGRYYSPFDVRQDPSKKWRHIDAPKEPLMSIQRSILKNIFIPIAGDLPPSMTGGLPGRSLLDHVRPHVGKEVVVTADIAACFPSIRPTMVFEVFRCRLGFSADLAGVLTKLTTFEHRLPQGAATSPFLAALVFERMHNEIARRARSLGIDFTQFVDDLAFSGPAGCEGFLQDALGVVRRCGFQVRRDKLQVMRRGRRQVICGLVVNSKMSGGRSRIRSIAKKLTEHRDALFILVPELLSLKGKIGFLRRVNSVEGARLERYADLVLPPEADSPRFAVPSFRQKRACHSTARHDEFRRFSTNLHGAAVQMSFAGIGRKSRVAKTV